MSSGKNIISTSKKEIYTKLLDIAGKYIDIEKSDFAQTGLFGYITESMAMSLRDSTFHTGMMYNESFLNTAIIPKSVYNWAKMFNIEVQRAEPSYANITITIPENAIESSMASITKSHKDRFGADLNSIGTTRAIILDKEDPIVAGEYYFSLEHSIVIYTKVDQSSGVTTYNASYILSEYESTNYQNINETNKALIVKYNNGNYEIFARAYQYRLNKYDRQLTSTTFLNKVQTFEFEDQFCGAKLFSISNGSKDEINLQYSEINLPNDIETAFYNLANEKELEIIFKYGDDRFYMPGANSNLMTYIYTTKGRDVPKSFTGTAIMLISSTTFKNLPMTIIFTDSYIVGGGNIPTLGEIKETIINEISTRNTITTQADLNSFFSVLTAMIGTVNDGKVSFIKQRDDIIRRLYNAYLLIRDNTNEVAHSHSDTSYISQCVPTNTIDVICTNSDVVKTDSKDNIIDISYGKFTQNENGQWVKNDNAENDYYLCPFRIKVLTRPVETIKYIYDVVNGESRLSYKTSGSGKFFEKNYFLPVSLKVKKSADTLANGSAGEHKYIFQLTTTSNLPLAGPDARSISGYINVTITNDAKVPITSDNVISCSKNNGIYTNVIEFVGIADSNDTAEYHKYFTGIDLSFPEGGKITSVKSSDIVSLSFGEMKIGDTALNDLVFTSDEELVFFQELDDIMESSISVTSELALKNNSNNKVEIATATEDDDEEDENAKTSTDTIIIHDVPVIHSSFLSTSNEDYTLKLDGFTEQLFTYINILKENLGRLETSTFFSLKFYNTYGQSYKYETSKTNLDLQLSIKLLDVYNDDEATATQLKKEIRSYIRRIVDKSNNSGIGLRYSDIVSATMQTGAYGNYIEYIRFLGINDTYTQVILPISESDSYSNLTSITPEWLNLDAQTINENIVFED